jgi:peptidoglycan hydrolase-like protein with peptidoglycan-binding domain
MSQEVLDAQQWLNETYGGYSSYISVPETGTPGTLTSLALVSALQIQYGVNSVDGLWGPGTSAVCDQNPLQLNSTGNAVRILQHGLYCKGYNPYTTAGLFDTATQNALVDVQEDAGLTGAQISLVAIGKQLGAVLGVDEYKLVYDGGDARIRGMQQAINHDYNSYVNKTGIRPCDGVYSRGTITALIYALQAEEHLPTSVANGNFGPTTRNCCPEIPYYQTQTDYYGNPYSVASVTQFVELAQYALYCIGHTRGTAGSIYDPGTFDGMLGTQTIGALHSFQSDVGLPIRDVIGIDEWMGLLVSTGNPDRAATACDCATRLSADSATALVAAGYQTVGRYLSGDIVDGSMRVAKNLLRLEMKCIFNAGLSLFVIFQDVRQYYTENPIEVNVYNYFTATRGYADAEKAFSVAKSLGIPRNAIIYFAVDYDFMDGEVGAKVLPYFTNVNAYADEADNIYRIGIYASRNICTRVKNAGYSESSFVSDLSTGYSGNMGYPLPDDWAFDQINEYGAGIFGIALDKDVSSGLYSGFSSFEQSHDNEWDLISSNGSAKVIVSGPSGVTSPNIPVYWSKIKVAEGEYEARYPMYDSIPVQAFFSYKMRNDFRPDADTDDIRYVYFRDVGGRLNAGYVDYSLVGAGTDLFSVQQFYDCKAFRYASGNGYIEYDPNANGTFILTVGLQYFDTGGYYAGALPAGSSVILSTDSITGASYPYLIMAVAASRPDNPGFQPLIPGSTYGFIDLAFHVGVLPSDRAMLTDIL